MLVAFNLESNVNWLTNGNVETGACEPAGGVTHPTGWSYSGSVTQVDYNTIYGALYIIDNEAVLFNFSAWIGGFTTQDDNAVASLTFTDQVNQTVGNITTLGPVLAVDRGDITYLLFQQADEFVPIGARSFTVVVTMTRLGGTYNNGYIDDIPVVLYL